MVRVLSGLAWVVVALALLVVSAMIHVGHPVTHRMLGRAVEQAVATSSPGVLRIGEIEEASLGRLALADVRYWDLEEKRQALDLKRVDVSIDTGSLLSDVIRISRVDVEGAELVFQKSWKRPEEGFMANFEAPAELRRQGKRVRVEEIAFEDVHARALLDATPYRLEGMSGRASVAVDEMMVIDLVEGRAVVELPGDGGTLSLRDVSATLPADPAQGLLARVTGKVELADTVADATLTYYDRDEPAPLEVRVESGAFSRAALERLGLTDLGELEPPLSGVVRVEGTFRTAKIIPELRGAGGAELTVEEPSQLEADWKLSKGDETPPAAEGDASGPLLLFLLLTLLLAAILVVHLALMVWLLRRGEGRPWWRLLPVASSVAAWMGGAKGAAATWWALVAVYLALVIGAA